MFVNLSGIVGLINLVLVLIVTILPQWRVNSPVSSQPNFNYLRVIEGLWIRCSGHQSQYFTCDTYDSSIIGLEGIMVEKLFLFDLYKLEVPERRKGKEGGSFFKGHF